MKLVYPIYGLKKRKEVKVTSEGKLYGLVLAGGKSSRMGTDKGLIDYHGMPQREYLYNLLKMLCDDVFMSIRPDQVEEIPSHYKVIVDENVYKGPFNGLMSAHNSFPNASWLVIACDLPMMDTEALEQLIAERNKSKYATAFASADSRLPEPLSAIWESGSFDPARLWLEEGKGSCPRKFLLHSDIKLVFPLNEAVLINANSREDYDRVIKELAT